MKTEPHPHLRSRPQSADPKIHGWAEETQKKHASLHESRVRARRPHAVASKEAKAVRRIVRPGPDPVGRDDGQSPGRQKSTMMFIKPPASGS